MALSPQDRAFYEEKLNWKSFFYLLASTVGIGTVIWPLMLFVQDWSAGLAADWTVQRALGLSFDGFMFGLVVSAIMYLLFRFFLWMGWLPSRR
jgi:hypothetical protein